MLTPIRTAPSLAAPKRPSRPPSWQQRYKLGVLLSKQMPHFATFEEIAEELGITKQNAYTETVLALGTFIYRMRERLGLPLNIELHYSEEADVLQHDAPLDMSILV